jgi:hypothetical protein
MPGGRGGLFVTIADNSRITGYLEGMPLERTLARSLSAVSEAPTSEDLSFRCAVKGCSRYSDLKEARGDYGICIWMSRS